MSDDDERPSPQPDREFTDDADAVIIRDIAAGDRTALASLYDRYGAAVYGLALRVLREPSWAEQAVERIFALAWTQAKEYRPGSGSVAGWLLRMVRDHAVAELRREGVIPTARLGDREGEPEEVLFLSDLSPEERRVIELAFYEGLTQQEVAQNLGIAPAQVARRLREGLLKLSIAKGRD